MTGFLDSHSAARLFMSLHVVANRSEPTALQQHSPTDADLENRLNTLGAAADGKDSSPSSSGTPRVPLFASLHQRCWIGEFGETGHYPPCFSTPDSN